MSRMDAAIAPGPDVVSLRESRIAILERLVAFAMQWLEGLRTEGETSLKALCRGARDFARISRWVRVAIFLSMRIGNGALDAPRPPKKVRSRRAADPDDESAAFEREPTAELRPEREPREFEHLECYLDRPFGEVIALICKGIGMTPDWDAWSCEPWAQEEIRTRPPTSPYADYATP